MTGRGSPGGGYAFRYPRLGAEEVGNLEMPASKHTKKRLSLLSLENTQERADELDRKLVEKTCSTTDSTRGSMWSRPTNTWKP